jgi:hypothetical protein
MTISANDLLMGGGMASAKFPTIGTKVTGRIIRDPEARQQTDIQTGDPLTFANGDPRMQIVVQLATDERDASIDDDNGDRALYIKGNMLNAVREAVRRAGAKGLEVGGTLTIVYSGDGEAKTRGFNAPKLYTASYTPPSAEAANNVLLMGAQPVPAAGTPDEAPPAGVDPATWARMDQVQRAAVKAALGQTPPF